MTRSRDTASIIPTVDAKGDLLVGTADNAIDNLPAGTNGTYLKANSASATGLEWATGVESIVDAKGDLLVGTADNTIDNLSPGTNGQVLTANSATTTGLEWTTPVSNENFIINGAFDIWQRGTSFNGDNFPYTADRWRAVSNAAATYSRQAAALTGFQFSIRGQRNSGSTSTTGLALNNTFESINSIPLAGKTMTLSFYARKGANLSGNLSSYVLTGTGTDQTPYAGFTGQATASAVTRVLETDWIRYTQTFTLVSNLTQISVGFTYTPTGTAGANDWFEITGVQLEAGPVATLFKRHAPSIQAELAACQRYYWRTPGSGRLTTGFGVSSTQLRIILPHPVTMRTSPGFSVNNSNLNWYNGISGGAATATAGIINNYNVEIILTTTGVAAGIAYGATFDSSAGFFELNAEF